MAPMKYKYLETITLALILLKASVETVEIINFQYRMTFRINANYFFLTYSQCPLPREAPLVFGPDKYIVAQEEHKDGGSHLHALFYFKNRKDVRNPRAFDIDGYHPNVERVRSPKAVATYVKKDGFFITNYTAEEIAKILGQSRTTQLCEAILAQGKIDQTLIRNHPELLFKNHDQIQKWLEYFNKGHSVGVAPSLKCRHIWLSGGSNSGKTTWLRNFMVNLPETEELPLNNDFKGINLETKVIWSDEFKGQLTIQSLNRLCDGNTKLNTKGGTTKVAYPLIIICSNYTIRTCYSNSSEAIWETLENRFISFEAPYSMPPLDMSDYLNQYPL